MWYLVDGGDLNILKKMRNSLFLDRIQIEKLPVIERKYCANELRKYYDDT